MENEKDLNSQTEDNQNSDPTFEQASESIVEAVAEDLVEEMQEASDFIHKDVPPEYTHDEPVTVQSVEFPSFDTSTQTQGEINKNLDLLMDVKLQLSVELGRAELPIKKVLELTRGSIVELDKIAGEPVELFANGKLVAHGEVVVIEDNFGLRITSIYESEDRLKNFQ